MRGYIQSPLQLPALTCATLSFCLSLPKAPQNRGLSHPDSAASPREHGAEERPRARGRYRPPTPPHPLTHLTPPQAAPTRPAPSTRPRAPAAAPPSSAPQRRGRSGLAPTARPGPVRGAPPQPRPGPAAAAPRTHPAAPTMAAAAAPCAARTPLRFSRPRSPPRPGPAPRHAGIASPAGRSGAC